MPANRTSLFVTEAYRSQLLSLRDATQAIARTTWNLDMADLEGTFNAWRDRTALSVTAAQNAALSASRGYLSAYVASETGEAIQPAPPIDAGRYVGKTRDGRLIAEGLQTALIGIRVSFKRGANLNVAMREGLNRALRMVEQSVMNAGRSSLLDMVDADDRTDGYERSVAGTCAACMALSGKAADEVHPGCQCVSQPTVSGVTNRFPLPTGAALFSGLTKAQQDAAVGPAAAEAIRNDDISLEDLVAHARQRKGDDYVTQKPLQAAQA